MAEGTTTTPVQEVTAVVHPSAGMHIPGMRQATIPALYIAATGTTPHTATLVNPICAYERFHRHYVQRATGTTQPAKQRDYYYRGVL